LAEANGRKGVDIVLERALSRWVRWVASRRATVLVTALLLSGLALVYSVARLGIESDKESLFPEDLPFRVLDAQFVETFPTLYENIVIVLDGPTVEATRRAAEDLVQRVGDDSAHFAAVYRPRGDFFETHGLLYLEPAALDDLADRLAEAQPILAALAEDPTLGSLMHQTRRGLEAFRAGETEDLALAPMLGRVERVVRSDLAGRGGLLDWAEIVSWGDAALDPRRQIIHVQPRLDYGSMAAGTAPIETLRMLTGELGLDEAAGFRLRMTGDMMLNFEEIALIRSQVTLAGLLSLLAVTGLLFAGLRSGRLVSATVLSLLMGLVLTAGFATLAIGHLNMISVAFAVLFIGLGVDFGIHLCMRYQELREGGGPPPEALVGTARSVGTSLVLCAATTAIGFFAFVPTDFRGVAELGIIAGVGMFISVAASFTIIPAVLAGEPASARSHSFPLPVLRLPVWPMRRPGCVVLGAVLLAAGAVAQLPELRFDLNPLGVRDPAAESVVVYEELLAASEDSPWILSHLARDETEALEIARRLSALPEVASARTLRDFVPGGQQEKLELIRDMGLFVDRREPSSRAAPVSIEPALEETRALVRELRLVDEDAAGSELSTAAEGLRSALTTWLDRIDADSPSARRARTSRLETSLLSTFDDLLVRLERAFEVGPVALEDLPRELRERMLSKGGIHRVEIVPTQDLSEEGALDRFVTAVQIVSPATIGPALAIRDSARTVVAALRQAFVSASVVIALMLLLLWRRIRDMALVMVPLLWAGLMTGGTMVLLGVDFNFADVIVLPLLLGIGVDSGIHMVHRHRLGVGESLLETSTARALVFSALTTIASFGSLALLPHRGMATLGQLLVIGVALTVAANVVLLPALIVFLERRASRSQGSGGAP